MKAKPFITAVAGVFAGVAVCLAADPNLGTWKLNEAKSKLAASASKNETVVYEAVGDSVKVTIDGVRSDGTKVHTEWTGKYDGKDYPVTGDSNSDARTYKKANATTTEATVKQAGKAIGTGRVVVAADGKSRTVTTDLPDASGKKVKSVAYYDKQ